MAEFRQILDWLCDAKEACIADERSSKCRYLVMLN